MAAAGVMIGISRKRGAGGCVCIDAPPGNQRAVRRLRIERLAKDRVMARAIWNGRIIAESDKTEELDGEVYFPESSLMRDYFRPSSTTSTDPKRGQARYLTLMIDGQDNQDAAFYYPDPRPIARRIKGYVAFWRGVEVEK